MSSTVTYKGSTIASVSNTTKTLETAGKYMEDDVTITDVSQATPVLQTVNKSYTPTETAQSEDVTAGSGYDGLEKVSVSVGAISSSYVGSGITRRYSTDLSASGGTVTAPAGYYSSSASKAVASGSATAPASISGTSATVSTSGTSTLTLSKTVSVTPSVSAGYVSSGTAGNSSVSLSASVNIRSSSSLSASGDTVTAPAGYYASAATKAVAAGTAGTPTATKGTVSNHSVSVTPSVTNTTGYITGSTKTGTAVTVTASELASGNKAITSNGTGIDVVGYSTVSVEVAGGGSGSVYQDAEGYLVLSDEPGTSVQVDPLSVTANGTYTASSGHAYSPVVVNVSGGGGPAEEKQINFIDYDGTILHSYTKAEINAMTQESELPANPSHTGLTAQGWNWTLAQIKAQLTAIPDGPVWVGQMYITTSGDTEIDVSFVDSARLSPILTIAVNGTITVDWGDNTTADTVTGTSLTTRQAVPHTYANTGDYTIIIHVVSGEFTFYGSSIYTLLRKTNSGDENRVYTNCIKNVRLGSNVTKIGNSAFGYCYSLASVTIPSTVTSIGSSAFTYCFSLASVTIPSDVTSIGNNAFSYCYSLTHLTIPSGITSIGTNAFYYCTSLASVTIPSTVTSIGDSAFSSCYGVAEYHIQPTTVPTGGTTMFNNIVSDCVIYVPYSADHSILNAYQTSTNWSTYASYMQEEPQ